MTDVAAAQVLSHEINHGYKYSVLPVETFNGATVHNMAHLAAMVDACEQPYLNFGLEGGRFITLDRQQVRPDGLWHQRRRGLRYMVDPARTRSWLCDTCF
jgi:hypothetical protein